MQIVKVRFLSLISDRHSGQSENEEICSEYGLNFWGYMKSFKAEHMEKFS